MLVFKPRADLAPILQHILVVFRRSGEQQTVSQWLI
jgi:hypothetical protein